MSPDNRFVFTPDLGMDAVSAMGYNHLITASGKQHGLN
jgi:hypothetical protein